MIAPDRHLDDLTQRIHALSNGAHDPPDARALPPAPDWPNVLPPTVGAYTRASALSIGVPPEMVEVPLLVFAGGIIGNAVQLRLKRGWNESPSLWAGVIADPGQKKTPSQSAAQWPINDLQRRAHERYVHERAQFEADMDTWNSRPKAERGAKPEAPTLQHFFTTDITIEKLVETLQYERGIAVIRDELSGFITSLNKYHAGDDRQQYLSLWSGTVIKSDRKTGGTAFAYRPAAGIYGGIQPDVASKLHNDNGERDGMVERFLLFRPEVQPSGWTDDEVDYNLLPPVTSLLCQLRSVSVRDDLDGDRITVQLHPDAKRIWVDWYNSNEAEARRTTGLRSGFCSKMPSQVARIALILHCLWRADDPRRMLDGEAMLRAIDVGKFFRQHLDRVLPLIGDYSQTKPVSLRARVMNQLRNTANQREDGWVRRAVLHNALGNVKANSLTEILSELEDDGVVTSREVKTAGRPAVEWRISPAPHLIERSDSSFPISQDSPTRPVDTANTGKLGNQSDEDFDQSVPMEGSV